MARPRKAKLEKRDVVLGVRLTAAEHAELHERAHLFGLSAAEFMRSRSLGYRLPATIAAQRQLAALVTALLRIGVNLNQLTHRAHLGREPNQDYLRAIAERISAILDRLVWLQDNEEQSEP